VVATTAGAVTGIHIQSAFGKVIGGRRKIKMKTGECVSSAACAGWLHHDAAILDELHFGLARDGPGIFADNAGFEHTPWAPMAAASLTTSRRIPSGGRPAPNQLSPERPRGSQNFLAEYFGALRIYRHDR